MRRSQKAVRAARSLTAQHQRLGSRARMTQLNTHPSMSQKTSRISFNTLPGMLEIHRFVFIGAHVLMLPSLIPFHLACALGCAFSFEPEVLELETKLKPFIPEYIPAVGDIDAFLKVCVCDVCV